MTNNPFINNLLEAIKPVTRPHFLPGLGIETRLGLLLALPLGLGFYFALKPKHGSDDRKLIHLNFYNDVEGMGIHVFDFDSIRSTVLINAYNASFRVPRLDSLSNTIPGSEFIHGPAEAGFVTGLCIVPTPCGGVNGYSILFLYDHFE